MCGHPSLSLFKKISLLHPHLWIIVELGVTLLLISPLGALVIWIQFYCGWWEICCQFFITLIVLCLIFLACFYDLPLVFVGLQLSLDLVLLILCVACAFRIWGITSFSKSGKFPVSVPLNIGLYLSPYSPILSFLLAIFWSFAFLPPPYFITFHTFPICPSCLLE